MAHGLQTVGFAPQIVTLVAGPTVYILAGERNGTLYIGAPQRPRPMQPPLERYVGSFDHRGHLGYMGAMRREPTLVVKST